MTIIQKLRASLVIRQVAHQQGVSVEQCRADIQEAIIEAWGTTDPTTRQRQIRLVGDSHIPNPDELILLIYQNIT